MKRLLFASAFLVAFLSREGSLFADVRVVSTTIEGKTKTVSTEVLEVARGKEIEIRQKNEDGSAITILKEDDTVLSQESQSKDGAIRMRCDGSFVIISGTWKGKALDGKYELKGLGFYGNGFEYALRALARNDLRTLRFPMIDPTNPSKSTVMELAREGTESFKGRTAIKVKISLGGIMSALWSARFLVSAEGTILRYKGNQGPGTPDMLTELVEERGSP
jgi:hypothetical protein